MHLYYNSLKTTISLKWHEDMPTFLGWTIHLTTTSTPLSPSAKRSYSVNRRTSWWSCHPDGWFDSRRFASLPVLPEHWSSSRQEQHSSHARSVSWLCSPDSAGFSVRNPLKNRRMFSSTWTWQMWGCQMWENSDSFLNDARGALVCTKKVCLLKAGFPGSFSGYFI